MPLRRAIDEVRRPRSLSARLVLMMTVIGIVGALAITIMLAVVITPSFSQLERHVAAAQIERTRAALADFRREVQATARDHGDLTVDAPGVHPRAARQLSERAIAALEIDGSAVIDSGGRAERVTWTSGAPSSRERFVATLRQAPLDDLVAHHGSAAFFARLGDDVVAIGVSRVRGSTRAGEPRRIVAVARRLTAARLSVMLPADAGIVAGPMAAPVETITLSRMAINVPIAGADGRAVASVRFEMPRDVSVLGRRMLLLAVGGSTLLLLMVLVMLRRSFADLVLTPLGRVEAHMQRVRASGSMTLLEDDGRRDEIGALIKSFNAMLSQLKDLREQIEVQSFALGRSESAVAVMHNVRNALNPISTILSQGTTKRPPIDRATLRRAADELGRADVPPERRRKLSDFVEASIDALDAAQREQVQELDVGRRAMAQVLEIIGEQQAHAHERPPLSPCDVTDIIAQNATIARYSGEVSIAFSFPAKRVTVLASRVLLSQVIGNLFSNAGEAIASTGRQSGSITVTIDEIDGKVRVRIRDDGEGFDPEITPTLFQRGFSTRPHKSGGLGLHWCANSVTAMDGSLSLESEGKGRGAVATLTLSAPAALAMSQAA